MKRTTSKSYSLTKTELNIINDLITHEYIRLQNLIHGGKYGNNEILAKKLLKLYFRFNPPTQRQVKTWVQQQELIPLSEVNKVKAKLEKDYSGEHRLNPSIRKSISHDLFIHFWNKIIYNPEKYLNL